MTLETRLLFEQRNIGYHSFNQGFADRLAESSKDEVNDVMIPLKIWFGFCDDYKKLILNCRHELILSRARSNLNAIHGGKNGATDASVSIEVNRLE